MAFETNQRMFHGGLSAAALADQLSARFNTRQRRVSVSHQMGSSLVQIGSQHGTPVTVHIADTVGGLLISMGRDRNWLDKAGDASQMIERAANNPMSLLAMVPDLIGEMTQENLPPLIWRAIEDLMALSRSLAGEENAPDIPKVCPYCGTSNPADADSCQACGGALPVNLPRVCPKCQKSHPSDALFCQACGTRLV